VLRPLFVGVNLAVIVGIAVIIVRIVSHAHPSLSGSGNRFLIK
jgi:hypothetical protein